MNIGERIGIVCSMRRCRFYRFSIECSSCKSLLYTFSTIGAVCYTRDGHVCRGAFLSAVHAKPDSYSHYCET